MELERVITKIRDRRLKDSDDALQAIAESERYLQQAYEGRCLFELIQNARDANKESNTYGTVIIEIKENTLSVSNTGLPFNEKGVHSITTIGRSPKNSQDFIGFKGIGFKSVLEVTDMPHIITTMGSIVFDRTKSIPFLEARNLKEKEIPIFFIPHFNPLCLSKEEQSEQIVTKIVLPLKKEVDKQHIEAKFREIGVHQVLLLGNLQKIIFRSEEKESIIEITKGSYKGQVRIRHDREFYYFKHFSPGRKVKIPDSIINRLEDKEKEIYRKEPLADISIVFNTNENGEFIKTENEKLYLFYPLKIGSGFPFLIHSYFLVDPARTTLRNSALNEFILEQIANYLAGEWLNQVKRTHRNNFLDFLAFERNKEAPVLNKMYDTLIEKLKPKKILYDERTTKFYSIDEITIADDFDIGLFPGNLIDGKMLVYIKNSNTVKWLLDEMDVDYLTYDRIADRIEAECIKQSHVKNINFFQTLYTYLVDHDRLNVRGKKVLLTSNWELLSSEENVFYGMVQQAQVTFPVSIQHKIHFIHPEIKIPDQRHGQGQTGYVEYSTELLVRRLLNLYDDPDIPWLDILISLLQLKISDKLLPFIRQRILLPVGSADSWVSPFRSPVYIPNDELMKLYSKDKFVNISLLDTIITDINELNKKLISFGAWDIPAIWFSNEEIVITRKDERFEYLQSFSRNTSPYFVLFGDWKIDAPQYLSEWFTNIIIQHWSRYINWIEEEDNPPIKYKSKGSSQKDLEGNDLIYTSSIGHFLRYQKWIKLEEYPDPLRPSEIIGIDPVEYIQPYSSLFRKYLCTLPIHYKSNEHLVNFLGISHLDSKSIQSFNKILNGIYLKYNSLNVSHKEFVAFYNKVLSKLFDLYAYGLSNKSDILILSDSMFLAINEQTQTIEWERADQIYYIDDKASYDILPANIKELLQPHFTNRDKNRFGQIGKKLGLDFKKQITQEIQDVTVLKETTLWDWFPGFAECLALIENLLDIDIDRYLTIFRTTLVKVSYKINIHLIKGAESLDILENIPHKIIRNQNYEIYTVQPPIVGKSNFFSNTLHDFFVEVFERDLQKVKLTLIDFYHQTDKLAFIERYEATRERVEEINSKLKGLIFTREQSFWIGIINTISPATRIDFIIDHTINFHLLTRQLGLDVDELTSINGLIDFELFHSSINIHGFTKIFDRLSIKLTKYNEVSELPIDFSDFYRGVFTSVKTKNKAQIEYLIHQWLDKQGIYEKSTFQDKMDFYNSGLHADIESPCLTLDINDIFRISLQTYFPDIHFPAPANWRQQYSLIQATFRRNINSFKKLINPQGMELNFYHEFIAQNENRSLCYFEGTIDYLADKYLRSKPTATIDPETPEHLNQYSNPPDTGITRIVTSSTDIQPQTRTNGGTIGRRLDGSNKNQSTAFIGLIAEKMVFEKLSELYTHVEWVSANAAKAGINLEGSDLYAYDISYIDGNDEMHYVEVKGNLTDYKHFYITYPEILMALEQKNNYHLFFVSNVLNNAQREIFDLGNMFLLESSFDIFNNDRFTAVFNTLEISFK